MPLVERGPVADELEELVEEADGGHVVEETEKSEAPTRYVAGKNGSDGQHKIRQRRRHQKHFQATLRTEAVRERRPFVLRE